MRLHSSGSSMKVMRQREMSSSQRHSNPYFSYAFMHWNGSFMSMHAWGFLSSGRKPWLVVVVDVVVVVVVVVVVDVVVVPNCARTRADKQSSSSSSSAHPRCRKRWLSEQRGIEGS
mmetsp:Transcript_556/g.1133  ORF Transcript_556/g.1133 Transcript_556/m.1133 type:complete len:116 (-) Transcript_556:78-425(-)